MRRTWQDNAHEFGALSKQGVDVRLAVLVACSVQPGNGQGTSRRSAQGSKVSGRDFAREAGTGDHRIGRHLTAWNACAAEGLCTASVNLDPDSASDPDLLVPTQEQFASRFDASNSGGRPRASVSEITGRMARDPEYRRSVVEALDPETRTEVGHDVHQATMRDIELNAMARGGRLPTPAEINAGVGESALDTAFAREDQLADVLTHLDAALATLRVMANLNDYEYGQVRERLVAIMDYGDNVAVNR